MRDITNEIKMFIRVDWVHSENLLTAFYHQSKKKCGVASIRWINWFKEGNLSMAKAYGLLNKENPSRMKSVLLDFHSTNISKEAREKDLRLKYSLKEVMLTYKLLFCVHNVISITEEKMDKFCTWKFFFFCYQSIICQDSCILYGRF